MEHDAVVRIGDKALFEALPAGVVAHDLGEAWTSLTGLPFVFAVWAVRREFLEREKELVREVHRAFLDSRDLSLAEVTKVAEQAARWEAFDAALLERYFTTLDFSLGTAQLAGIREFARRTGGSAGYTPDTQVELLAMD